MENLRVGSPSGTGSETIRQLMCGISGIFGPNVKESLIEAMVSIQRHRGPDDSGMYLSPEETIGLGHNRLSIIDLTSAGHQPMCNHDGTLWIVFNGEIYNYLELGKELSRYPFKSRTDTEVLLAAYEKWGDRCVDKFIGMFAFAIWDSRQHVLFCARDRLGIKPFHYTWCGNSFYFASEIKAILAAGVHAEPDWQTWGTYLAHGYYDHDARTFFRGINSLAPGHILKVEDGRIHEKCYWDLPVIASDSLSISDDEAADRLFELLKESVRLRLRSDVPVGVNLSGGLDSASLMVAVDELLRDHGRVETFTASFSEPAYDESDFASAVPRQTEWIRHIQRLDPDTAWQLTDSMLWHQEAPYGGIATIAYHYLHELTKESGVTVLLEGQGVDELLAGYAYFRPHHHLDLLKNGEFQTLRNNLKTLPTGPTAGLLALRNLMTGQDSQLYQDGTWHLYPDAIQPEIISQTPETIRFPRPFSDHLSNALYRDLRFTKLPRVLRMNDRLSMAFSLELREPYLDHRLVEFVFRLPGHQKINEGKSKFLLRHAMRDNLPDHIRLAEKRSVVTPQREWLRSILRPQVEDLIHSQSFRQRGIFDVRKAEDAYRRFCRGEGDNAFFIWQWINTEQWFRMFMDERTCITSKPAIEINADRNVRKFGTDIGCSN